MINGQHKHIMSDEFSDMSYEYFNVWFRDTGTTMNY